MADKKDNNSNFQRAPAFGSLFGSSANKLPNSFDDILWRLKSVFGVETDTDFARCMGFKQGSVSGAKQKQAIPPAWIMEVALTQGVSADWLLTGEGEMKRGQAAATPKVAAASPDVVPRVETTIYNDMNAGVAQSATNIADLVAKTIEVLQSKTVFQTALQSNIEAFHHAIVLEKKIDQVEDRIMAKISGRLDALEVSNQRLEEENAQLRQELESCRVQPGLEDTG